ncbi:helix-turn-helix domain-containing protein [Nocardia sp. CC201C]|uniref:helix-turn-helix domain-containing protein n=1 Tax=Nocardia sp. CC201C TaxID=3044575 RepID=UPI0024A8E813|nr:helix-turn-helix domain-containing protein [Nocardia sp. CC201C]
MAGTYSNRTDLLEGFAELRRRIEQSGPRRSQPTRLRASGGPKKQLTPEEAAEIVAKYEAGASMAQLKVEHHMAKRTVARVLRETGVAIRPRGGKKVAERHRE